MVATLNFMETVAAEAVTDHIRGDIDIVGQGKEGFIYVYVTWTHDPDNRGGIVTVSPRL